MFRVRLGDRIRTVREAAGKTQLEVAVAVGVDPKSIYRYEKDQTSPSVDTLALIAAACGVTLASLFEQSDDPAEVPGAA